MVEELFATLEGAKDPATRERLFHRLKTELERHKEAEERTFYAALSNLPELADRIEEALEEHADVEELLEELAALSPEDDDFLAQVQELKEEVEHHVEEEEGEIFARAQARLDDAQAAKIAEEFLSEKQALGT
jgi:uncharacterized coiled-coil DUF342 family protein